jgi:hypothetical protein
MSAKRKPRFPTPVRPKSNGDNGKYADYVSRAGVKAVAVGMEDRHNPEMITVQAQLGGRREPKDFFNPPNVIDLWEVNPHIKTTPLGQKWCSVQDHWVDTKEFSDMKGTFDGKHPYCKACRAAHAKRMYWLKKEADVAIAIAA